MGSSLFLWFASVLHAYWGLLAIWTPDVAKITAIAEMSVFGSRWAGVVLVLVAVLSMLGDHVRFRHRWYGWGMLLPQQAALVMSAVSAVASVIAGHYPDGYAAPRAFIAADQGLLVVLCGFHVWAVSWRLKLVRI